jgi:hypothetical protein
MTKIKPNRRRKGIAGQILPVDLGAAYYLVFGPVYYRYLGALAGHAPIEPNFITNLVNDLLVGIRAPASTEPNGS